MNYNRFGQILEDESEGRISFIIMSVFFFFSSSSPPPPFLFVCVSFRDKRFVMLNREKPVLCCDESHVHEEPIETSTSNVV